MRIRTYRTVVLGSGAAGLCAALRLDAEGVKDFCVVTEGLNLGTSINAGSDKQTYYKLGLCGSALDSPRAMAESYLTAGGADGDLALVESATSPRAFFHLANLGVPFPYDAYGQYAGYKTDHDPAKRATSCGPYTSREMCRAMIREVERRNIAVFEGELAVELTTRYLGEENGVPKRKVVGLIAIDAKGEPIVYRAENVVFAVGGPGGLYKTSVYPEAHVGSIGLAIEAGAATKGLPDGQFGLASFTDLANRKIKASAPFVPKEFRWNVSGTYMQVVPKFISTDADGVSNPREFLREYFDDLGDLFGRVFLKGYQWPFDARKVFGGSSFIDLCVFRETTVRGRRVFLDYRADPEGFSLDALPDEAREYLEKSGAAIPVPFARLQKMNPSAIELYRDWGLDLATEPLEIAVCAQHCNGGLDVDCRWRSVNVEGLYPIGEVAGTHGVARPGGSALNAGQVGAFRAAAQIAREASTNPGESEPTTLSLDEAYSSGLAKDPEISNLVRRVAKLATRARRARLAGVDWRRELEEIRTETTRVAGILRSGKELASASSAATEQWRRLTSESEPFELALDDGYRFDADERETLRVFQLFYARATLLRACWIYSASKVGSRGSSLAISPEGRTISEKFPEDWRALDEDPKYRDMALCAWTRTVDGEIETEARWRATRPIPEPDDWFENVWRDFRDGTIYR